MRWFWRYRRASLALVVVASVVLCLQVNSWTSTIASARRAGYELIQVVTWTSTSSESIYHIRLRVAQELAQELELLAKETRWRNISLKAHSRNELITAKNFTLPHPKIYKDIPKVFKLSHTWLEELKSYLASISPMRTITITVANQFYEANLLNWLVSANLVADPPLQHYIVIAFSQSIHQLLSKRGIPVVMVPLTSVVWGWSPGVAKVWMCRLALIRLLNHWGYNVVHYDADAVILKNPKPLFDKFQEYDIVGSRGKLGKELKNMWGFAICMGAVLFRSTANVGKRICIFSYMSLFFV